MTVTIALSCNFHTSLLSSVQDKNSFANLFILLLCNNGTPPNGKTKREVSQLFQSHSSEANFGLVYELQNLFSSISLAKDISVVDTESLESTFIQLTENKVVSFTKKARVRTDDSFLPDQVAPSDGNIVHELRSITRTEGTTVKTVVRYGNGYSCWWMYSSCSTSPAKVKVDKVDLIIQFHFNWISYHYEIIDSVDMEQGKCHLEYLGGQGHFVCDHHRVSYYQYKE